MVNVQKVYLFISEIINKLGSLRQCSGSFFTLIFLNATVIYELFYVECACDFLKGA